MEIKEKYVWYVIVPLILLLTLGINLRVATSTPIIFGDEGYFGSRGEWILENLEIPKYYHIYSDNTLFNTFDLDVHYVIFVVSSFFLFGGETLVKALDPMLTILTGLMIFLFARRFYSYKTGILSMFFFLILPCVITYSIFLYTDMLFTLFMISSLYFLLRGVKEDSNKYILISGIFAGFSILNKEVGFLIIIMYLIVAFFYRKEWLKKFGILLLIFVAFATPLYGFHNFVLLGNPGLPMINNYFPTNWVSPEIEILDQETLQLHTSGTYAGIFQYGILNYIQFSYGLGVFVFIVMGLSYLFYRKKRDDIIILLWIALLFASIYYYTGEGKVESLSRWLLAAMPLFAISAGISAEKIYDFLRSYGENMGKVIGILFIFMIVIFGLSSANAKAASLEPIKTWSPAFVKGCDWIRRNTPEDSKIVSIWQHHGMYQCKRDVYWAGLPNKNTIVLYSNDTSYDLLKMEEMDYIYFQKFSIAFEKTAEVYPVEFVRYVQNSDKFEKVYEYPENCMMSQGNDCVVVYKIIYNPASYNSSSTSPLTMETPPQ